MLVEADCGFFKASTMGVDFTTANVGGAISTNAITGSSIGEIFFAITPAALGGGSQTQNQKIFFRNSSVTDDAIAVIFWIANCLALIPSDNTLSVQSTSALDDATYFMRCIGFDSGGNPITIDVYLDGTNLSTSVSSMTTIKRALLMSTITGLPTPGNGDITLKCGSTVLTIATAVDGFKSFTGEVKLGIEATQNDSTTIATVAATPSPTMFLAYNMGNSLSASSGGNIPNCGSSPSSPNRQGIWCNLVVAERITGSSDCQFVPRARVSRV